LSANILLPTIDSAAQLREMAPLKNQKKIQQNTQEKIFPDFRYNMKSNSTLVQLDNRE